MRPDRETDSPSVSRLAGNGGCHLPLQGRTGRAIHESLLRGNLPVLRKGDLWSPADMAARLTGGRPKAAPTVAQAAQIRPR